jgi:YbgC/YbaW family acyl-CoA thioester hydrolase
MERIKVNLPEHFPFSIKLPIRITDLNYGGHVGNDAVLSLIHEARMQFLNHHGYSEMSVEGVGVIMADVAIEYKRELAYGNVVTISVAATGFDKLGFDMFYKIEVESEGKITIAGKAKTGMMCFDYNNKKRVSVPEKAAKKLTGNFQG